MALQLDPVATKQVWPVQPAGHEQLKPSTVSEHTPPFLHGDEAHASTFVAHVAPLQPDAQAHEKVPELVSVQVPPCRQGELAQLVGASVDSQFKP